MSPANSFEQFLAMGGYGNYVWPAYAVALLTIGVLVVRTIQAHQVARAKLAQLEKAH